ncbi:MAG TPA: RDD family protein [Magnetospirillaceae bacterium]|nr:RDD family protein [Magnetospirillaceae bacterium]
MAICPACGAEQRDSSAFCAACGAVLDRPDTSAAAGLPPPPAPPPGSPAAAQQQRPRIVTPAAPVEDFGDIGQYIARRLLALIVDLIGVSALLATTIGYFVARSGADPHSFSAFFETAVYVLFALIIYLCISEAYLGTTLGKALVGLRVCALGGGSVGIVRGVVRNVFLPFDLLGIGFALAALTPRRRRIGDFVAGTEVVNATRPAIGAIAAIALLGAWTYALYAYADGLRTAQVLSNGAEIYGPSLLGGGGTPPPGPTPLPERSPVPTEQPITVPTVAPSPGRSAASPAPSPAGSSAGASASPSTSPQASPSNAGSSSASPAGASPSAPSSPAQTSPGPATTTS